MSICIGQKINKLLVVEFIGMDKFSHRVYRCQCECGNFKVVKSYNLSGKNSQKSCGCERYRRDNLVGKRFGSLIVKNRAYSKGGKVFWVCICDCGNETEVRGWNLKCGYAKSCGCKQYSEERSKKIKQTCFDKYGVNNPMCDKKISLKNAKSQNNSCILYHWKTGEEIVCQASYERKVVGYLNQNKIDFDWQIVFDMPNGKTYRVDLYFRDQNKYIEIKGYFRKDAKEKWEWFHKEHSNSELWDKKKLKELGIL